MFIYTLLLFIAVFSTCVIAHEFGHYFFARLFGTGVKEFAVGFGNKIFSITDKNNTMWAVRAIPFGGYVNIIHEKDDTVKGDDVNEKHYWQQLLIFLGGPLANVLLALMIAFPLIFFTGMVKPQSAVIGIVKTSSVDPQTLKVGDKILSVDGVKVHNWRAVQMALIGKKQAWFSIQRNDIETRLIKHNTAQIEEESTVLFRKIFNMIRGYLGYDPVKNIVHDWQIGPQEKQKIYYSFIDSFICACAFIAASFMEFLYVLRMIAVSGLSIISGPVGMGKTLALAQNLEELLWLMTRISLGLGFFNILPLPMLDGGKIFTATIEKVIGRKLSERFMMLWGISGLVLVGGTLICVTFLDLLK